MSAYPEECLSGLVLPEGVADRRAPVPDELNHSTLVDDRELGDVRFALGRRHVRMISEAVRNDNPAQWKLDGTRWSAYPPLQCCYRRSAGARSLTLAITFQNLINPSLDRSLLIVQIS